MRRRQWMLAVGVALLLPVRGGAQEAPAEDFPSELQSPALEEDLRFRVIAGATKREQTVQTAPAVAEVITAEDIRAAGYRSVGEALMSVAGLVVYHDLVYYNVGVRGIFGGERAGSRGIKVLLDGQPVSLRTSSANFLGPELVPIELVERIEIIRGPGSVLYGANAFLGVINVVTKSASAFLRTDPLAPVEKVSALTLTGGALLNEASPPAGTAIEARPTPRPGWFGSAVLGAQSGEVEAVGGAGVSGADRSGLALPTSSPRYRELAADPYSREDTTTSEAFYGRVGFRSPLLGAVRLSGSYSNVRGHGQFQDRNTLNDENHIGLAMAAAGIDAERKLDDWLVLRAFGAYSQGGPTEHQHVGVEGAPTALRLDTGFRAVDAGVDAFAVIGQWATLLAGADFSWDEERRPSVQLLYTETVGANRVGSVIVQDEVTGAVPFRTLGAFGLLTLTPFAGFPESFFRDLGLTGGVRYQRSSIYGPSLDWRGGLVLPLGDQLYTKVLGGSSFKGPSAEELYSRPLGEGDLSGNPNLKPQRATTVELVAGWLPSRHVHISLVGYLNFVRDQIRYRHTIAGQIPENVTRQDTRGLELTARVVQPLGDWMLGGFANGTFLSTTVERPGPMGVVPVAPDQYPPITGNAGLNVRHEPSHLGLYVEARFMGPRPPSRDNIEHWSRGRAYELPPVLLLDAVLSTDFIRLGSLAQLRAAVRATNVLNTSYALPGFFGFDIPGQQRAFMHELSLSF